TINSLPAAPTATATQSFCGSATVANLAATAPVGSNVKWYAAASGGSALAGATALVNGSTYYAESENSTTLCVSSSRTAVTVTINSLPAAPTATAAQSFCGSATIADLSATAPVGSTVKWYAASSGGSTLTGATALVNSTTYYAESENTTTFCISNSRTAVTVTINVLPAAPTASVTTQPTCADATGTITITAPTGAGMTYSIDGSTYTNTTGIFTSVPVGTYTVTAKSTEGCISPATTSVTLNAPICTNLSITKTVDNSTPNVGSTVEFTLTVTNNGPDNATGVTVTDNLPSGYTYVSDDGLGAYNVGTGVWAIGNLNNGATAILNITATVKTTGNYANTATVNGDQTDPTPANNTSTNTPVPVDQCNLSIDKSVNNGSPNVGDNIIFTLTVTNNGPSDATGVKVTDNLPSGFTYVSDNGAGAYNDGTGIWTIGNLANSATTTLNITVTVNASGSYSNTATVSGDQADPTPANNSDTSTPTPGALSNLAITKTVDNSTPNVGSNVVFRLTATNNGPSDASGVKVTDLLPSGYTYVSDNSLGNYNSTTGVWSVGNLANGASSSLNITAFVKSSGVYTNTATISGDQTDPTPANNSASVATTPVAQSNLSIVKSVNNATPNVASNVVFTLTVTNNGPSDATGVSATDALPSGYTYVSDNGSGAYINGTGLWTIGNLVNGASASLDITAKVNASGSYANTATVSSPVADPTPGNNTSTSTPVPVPQSNLSITKSVSNGAPIIGSNIVFTLTATNHGPSDATGVSATDALPSGYTYVSDNGSGAYISGTGVWTIGNLANGTSASLDITAKVNASGNYTNSASVTADQPDPSTGDNTASINTTPVAQSNLTIVKTVNNSTPNVGVNVVFTLTVTNNGPSNASGVKATDALPSGYIYVSDNGSGAYNSSTGLWTIGNLNNGSTVTLDIIASVNATGNYTNTATVTGDQADPSSDDETSSVSTTPNFIPVATNDITNTNQDTPVTIDVLSNDTGLNDGPVVVTITVNPTNGTYVVNADNTITYTPNSGFTGNDSFTYKICDNNGDCATATITITVNSTSTDHLPVAVDDNTITQENIAVVISVLANDNGLEDGGLVVTVTNQPTHGTIVINPDNTITYIPSTGYVGNDSFTYQVCDADGDCSTATVSITVNATITDHVPVAVDDNTTTQENNAVVISVLANDTGLEDGGLVVTVTNQPTHGTIVINLDNTITYTPSNGYVGNDNFTYQVCDADGDCATAAVTITVNATITDHIPVAVDDNTTTQENNAVVISVLANDTGLEDGGLVITTNQPTHGTIVINLDNTITYTPSTGYVGNDSFTYQVCDADGDCATATVTITVNSTGTDHLPVAVDDNASTEKDKEVVINVLSNDTGLEDGGLAVTVVNQPIHGTIVINADNTITYTPETGYAGEDSFTYQVCDVDGDCSTAIANITIENTIIIPDGFSPNGDGINDNFVIPGLENYNRVSIDILNRWGNIVYTSSKYENNWDGRSNTGVYSGTQLPSGTYFYVVKIHDNGKKSTGYVYLTR
ncbi:MAG TPA: hypothetical protein DIW31_09175, partial [Bacteroidales bacterium]|nr:hypothetical protein [Bacteroidales bacterium]